MNIIEISCPSKTFIIGEYAVLDGGYSILLNTEPRFKCTIRDGIHESFLDDKPNVFKDASGKVASNVDIFKNPYISYLIKKQSLDSRRCFLEWNNPHNNKGGFGFSSAQFNMLYAYSCFLQDISVELIKPKEVWRLYRSIPITEGYKPSGADLISQWMTGLSVFKQDPLVIESYTSIFPDLDCFIIRTGDSFDTFKHLQDLENVEVSDLKKIAKEAVESLENPNLEQFLKTINDYRKCLIQKGFATEKSKEVLDYVSKIEHVKAYKGCGAMGAETVILFFDTQYKEEIRSQLDNFEIIADKDHITYGIEYHKGATASEDSN